MKHIAGPFFTEGSYTKNSVAEVDDLMANLCLWSSASTRPRLPTAAEEVAMEQALTEMTKPIEIERFVGRWFVVASNPTSFEKGMINAIEDYTWNAKRQCIDVVFSMQSAPDSKPTILLQRAMITNKETNTKWAINPKIGVYLPLGFTYLVPGTTCSHLFKKCCF